MNKSITEEYVCAFSPSQFINIGIFSVCIGSYWLILPLFIALWTWLVTWNTEYILTPERLILRHGVFNKQIDELELYRVKDYRLEKPFYLRIFSLGNISLVTSDRTHPVVRLYAVNNSDGLREHIRTFVEKRRWQMGVREFD